MPSASTLKSQIEADLAKRIPSALTPAARTTRAVMPTGISTVDDMLNGGLPVGAITEIVGPECSGRTALAMSFLAQITQTERVCAWVDASDTLSPESAAASGMDLERLLWVRCGVARTDRPQSPSQSGFALPKHEFFTPSTSRLKLRHALGDLIKPWVRMEQAIQATDLLLQGGGFTSIVLDLGSIAPQHVARIPMATWFRYSAAAARTQASVLLLTQHSCAKSSAGLVLRCQTDTASECRSTVLTGLKRRIEVARQQRSQTPETIGLHRKPPQRACIATWQSRTAWAGVS